MLRVRVEYAQGELYCQMNDWLGVGVERRYAT